MKRPIKFRGKRLGNGEFIYGNLMHVRPETATYYFWTYPPTQNLRR